MNYIRYIFLILISIPLVGCVNTKPTNKSESSDLALGAQIMHHVSDKALVDFYKTFTRTDSIMQSNSSTDLEKKMAEDEQEAGTAKLISAADTKLVTPQYSDEEKALAMIDMAQAMQEAKKNHIDITKKDNAMEAI